MALGALSLPAIEPAFGADNTAMVPVTAGNTNQKLGIIEIRSPMDDVMDFFAGIDKSLINLVEFTKKSFQLEEKDSQIESLERQDTDNKEEEEEGYAPGRPAPPPAPRRPTRARAARARYAAPGCRMRPARRRTGRIRRTSGGATAAA